MNEIEGSQRGDHQDHGHALRARRGRDSWRRIFAFFGEYLGGEPAPVRRSSRPGTGLAGIRAGGGRPGAKDAGQRIGGANSARRRPRPGVMHHHGHMAEHGEGRAARPLIGITGYLEPARWSDFVREAVLHP